MSGKFTNYVIEEKNTILDALTKIDAPIVNNDLIKRRKVV